MLKNSNIKYSDKNKDGKIIASEFLYFVKNSKNNENNINNDISELNKKSQKKK